MLKVSNLRIVIDFLELLFNLNTSHFEKIHFENLYKANTYNFDLQCFKNK